MLSRRQRAVKSRGSAIAARAVFRLTKSGRRACLCSAVNDVPHHALDFTIDLSGYPRPPARTGEAPRKIACAENAADPAICAERPTPCILLGGPGCDLATAQIADRQYGAQ